MKKKENWAEKKFGLQCCHNTSGDPTRMYEPKTASPSELPQMVRGPDLHTSTKTSHFKQAGPRR